MQKIRPYYHDGTTTLYHGDCLDVLRQLKTSFDAVITDPPYGIDYQHRTMPKIANDKRPFIWWLYHAFQLTKDRGSLACFCRWDVQESFRVAIEAAGYRVRSQVIWDRCSHGMGDTKAEFAPQHDVVWFGIKGRFAFPDKRPRSVVSVPKVPAAHMVHPTQKPLALMGSLIKSLVPPGGILLDPMAGSGSTLEAAKKLGVRAVGIELMKENCEKATERLCGIP